MREKPPSSMRARRRGRRLAEKLLEDESLRDDLTEDEARRMLDWGLKQAKKAASRTFDLSEEEARLELERESERLRSTMRRVNRLMSKLGANKIEEGPEITRLLHEMKRDDQLALRPALEDRIEELAAGITELDRDQAFDKLMDLVSQEYPEGE